LYFHYYPPTSEFANNPGAARYDLWFRAKIKASIDDPRPSVPHEEVMAEIHALLQTKRRKHEADQ
jgi:hypothetical protein